MPTPLPGLRFRANFMMKKEKAHLSTKDTQGFMLFFSLFLTYFFLV